MTGPSIRGGGGGVKRDTESATGIDPTTGLPSDSGITLADSLSSVGKTIARACGVSQADVDEQITHGEIVKGALK